MLALFFSLTVLMISWFFQRIDWTIGLVTGFVMGFVDNLAMFSGIKEGVKNPADKALTIMKKNMLKRTVIVLLCTVLAIKGGIHVPALFIAFLLIHLVCLVSIIINAKGDSPDAERSEMSVGRKTNN